MKEERLQSDYEFWGCLVETCDLDEAIIDEYRTTQSRGWSPLGSILLRDGVLSMSQVIALLAIQANEPDVRIGDLAVREGHCTQATIRKALVVQREESPHPIELLMADSRVDKPTLFDGVTSYVRFLEGLVHRMRTRFAMSDVERTD